MIANRALYLRRRVANATFIILSIGTALLPVISALAKALQPLAEYLSQNTVAATALAVVISGVLLAGMTADKFDQLAAFQNFIIVPLTFLSGVFYSIHSLPPFWQALSHGNPFFYMIDGFRYGFFGVSDISPAVSLAIVAAAAVAVGALTLKLLATGWKLRT